LRQAANFDLVARMLAGYLSDQLRQPVVVENRAGASGNIATEAMVRSAPDGYTLLLAGAVNAVNATLFEKLPFNFANDAVPVSGVVRFPNVMTVNASLPVATLSDFIEYAKAHPATMSHGSSGTGTTQHLAGELFKLLTGTVFTHVPYRGASQAINDLLGQHVQVLFEPLPVSLPFIKAGRLRALGITSATRSEALPDVMAIGELVKGFEATGWTGVCAPRGTPASAIQDLNAAIQAALANPTLRARFVEIGGMPITGSPADFGKLIASETDKWAQVIRAGNIRPS
jgi:tripartite-type tricarboxylate transporter receptor subunit TctC